VQKPNLMMSSMPLQALIHGNNSLSPHTTCQGLRSHLSRRSEDIFSNWARVMVASMCFGPSAVAVMKGSEMLVLDTPDSSTCRQCAQRSQRAMTTVAAYLQQ